MHVHMYMNLRVCLSVRVSVYMYVCTYIYKFACLYATVALERLKVLDASLQHPGQPQPVLADLCQISAVKLACESLCVCVADWQCRHFISSFVESLVMTVMTD